MPRVLFDFGKDNKASLSGKQPKLKKKKLVKDFFSAAFPWEAIVKETLADHCSLMNLL